MSKEIIGTNNIIKNRYIRYELTGKCNYSCHYCSYKHTFNNGFHSDIWEHVVDFVNVYNAKSKYSNQLMLWGGEPTLHPNFFDICKNVAVPFGLYTNLSQNLKFFEHLFDYTFFTELYISIHVDQDKNINNTLKKIKSILAINGGTRLIRLAVMLEENHIDDCISIFSSLDKSYQAVLKAVDTSEKYYSTDVTKYNKYMKEYQYILYNGYAYTRFDIIQDNLPLKYCKGFLCNCPSHVIHVDVLGNIFNCLVFDESNVPIGHVTNYDSNILDRQFTICKCRSCYNYLLKTGIRRKL